MRITSLIENNLGKDKSLQAEHGLSLFIEVDGKKILFDTGETGKFINNARRLGVDLALLDYVVISHGHSDHSGGLKRLIKEINPRIKLIVGDDFFNKKYSKGNKNEYKYRGNKFERQFLEEHSLRANNIDEDIYWISKNVCVVENFNRDEKYENRNNTMYIKEKSAYEKDMVYDEIALGIKTDKGLVVVVGCSHPGIINIVDTMRKKLDTNIHSIVGGTHLITENKKQINKIIHYIMKNDIQLVAACHCTGDLGQGMLAKQLKNKFVNYRTGDVLEW